MSLFSPTISIIRVRISKGRVGDIVEIGKLNFWIIGKRFRQPDGIGESVGSAGECSESPRADSRWCGTSNE